ncbi:flavodoxin family protein BilS [uncultured Clostridium sp.]|uniref:flavodoxin family protein BilS n=1 Tax=uncultured Clostridium sp. TaxID=59620 RepID=UPI0025F8A571|nr:flavodoxin family protein BilS [uncultured Clostridium sp.]
MKYAIVYSSRTGNTKMLADQALEVFRNTGEGNCLFYGDAQTALQEGQKSGKSAERADILCVGFWTDKGNADADALAFLKMLGERVPVPGKLILFGTAGFGSDRTYYDRVIHNITQELSETVNPAAYFMCQGRMASTVLERYQAMLEADPGDSRARRMIENYHAALSHPGQEDFTAFGYFLEEIIGTR